MKKSLAVCMTSLTFLSAHDPVPANVANLPAGPKVTDWSNFFVTGAFISWKACVDGLDYAESGVATSTSGVASSGHVKGPGFDFEPGLKIGAGLNFRYDGWDLYANYTWLNPGNQRSSIKTVGGTGALQTLWPIFIPGSANPTFFNPSQASNRWKLGLDVLDSELGRNFFLSSKLTVRPFVGFKAAWTSQRNHIHYTDVGNPTGTFAMLAADLLMKQKFIGFGPRGGLNTAWKIAEMWSIVGNAAFSELWCTFRNSRKDSILTSSNIQFDTFHVQKKIHDLTPVMELAVGLRYTHEFKDGKWRVELEGTWELQTFFSHNRFIGTNDDLQGNLTLQGGTARIGFAF